MKYQNLSLLVSCFLSFGLASNLIFAVDNQTDITAGENASHAVISRVDCLSRNKTGRESTVKEVYVEIELLDKNCKDGLHLWSLY